MVGATGNARVSRKGRRCLRPACGYSSPERRGASIRQLRIPLETGHHHLPPSHHGPRDRSRRPSTASPRPRVPRLAETCAALGALRAPISSSETTWRLTQSKRCREIPAPRKTPLENSGPESDGEPPGLVSSGPIRFTAPTTLGNVARNYGNGCHIPHGSTNSLVRGGAKGIRTAMLWTMLPGIRRHRERLEGEPPMTKSKDDEEANVLKKHRELWAP